MGRSLWIVCLVLVANQPLLGQAPVEFGPPVVDASCCGSCMDNCCHICGPEGRTWLRADYLLWWVRDTQLPPLITTSPPGTDEDDAGVLGVPGTRIVAGNEDANGSVRTGGRFTLGHWLDCEQTIGIEAGFFILESQPAPFGAGSDGSVILARPFINGNTGQPDAELVSFPDVIRGAAFGSANSGNLLGANVDLRKNICCGCCSRIDCLVGYRFLRYDEGLLIRETLFPTTKGTVPGTRIDLFDSFTTENEFHGLDLGLVAEYRRDIWFVEVLGKLAVGGLDRRVDIRGGTLVTAPGFRGFNQGGLLALSSNIGSYDSAQCMVLPEIGLTLGCQLTEAVRLRLGYAILWLPDVARAANQVDLVVNPNLIPPVDPPVAGPQRPSFTLNESNIWVQGLALGVEIRF